MTQNDENTFGVFELRNEKPLFEELKLTTLGTEDQMLSNIYASKDLNASRMNKEYSTPKIFLATPLEQEFGINLTSGGLTP
ncbi:hypothetical protein TNCV_1874031 [Trichonephila clavipes]|nr:hypothetical protein TNCV_1874031 [Trichonephila clavipes]